MFAELQSNQALDRKRNWARTLPTSAQPVKLAIFDPELESLTDQRLAEEYERVRESLLAFPGLRLRRSASKRHCVVST